MMMGFKDDVPLDSDVLLNCLLQKVRQANCRFMALLRDYDFNDVALNYQVVLKLNAKGLLFKWILSVMLNQTDWFYERNWYRTRKSISNKVSPVLF
jgi:hypothetical protein